MFDKYKVADDIKKNSLEYTHKEAIEIAKETAKIYFDDICTFAEAIKKAKEVLRREIDEALSRPLSKL